MVVQNEACNNLTRGPPAKWFFQPKIGKVYESKGPQEMYKYYTCVPKIDQGPPPKLLFPTPIYKFEQTTGR
jgi:hypothetical protein